MSAYVCTRRGKTAQIAHQINLDNFSMVYPMGSGSCYAPGPIILDEPTWVRLGPIEHRPRTKAKEFCRARWQNI